jgi:molybdopterin-containing oxidoreductase family iron-sulfur binding subunit
MAREGGRANRIAIVTPLLTGSLDRLFDTWAKVLGARRLRYEAFGYEAVRTASRLCFGRDAVPHYDLARAEVLVSFGADFLETWLSTVEHSGGFAQARRLRDGRKSRFIHVEPRLSLTASNADEWLASQPGTEILVAPPMVQVILAEGRSQTIAASDVTTIRNLAAPFSPEAVAGRTGIAAQKITDLARLFSDPQAGPGRSLAIAGGAATSGSNATGTQVAVHLLNYVAGNLGTTAQFGPDASYGHLSTYGDIADLVTSMRAGDIDVLVTYDVNPAFTLPGALDSTRRSGACLCRELLECAGRNGGACASGAPTHSPLESWGDAEPRAGCAA